MERRNVEARGRRDCDGGSARLNVGKVVWVLQLCCLPEGENIRDPEKTVECCLLRGWCRSGQARLSDVEEPRGCLSEQ